MRIAQVAPLYENVPPSGYGGTERVIAGLCDGLVAAGHDVTLFATGRSRTSARLQSFVEAPLRERMDPEELAEVSPHLHLRMLADIYGRGDEFDVIHAHTDVWTLPFAELTDTPTVITMHGRLDSTARPGVVAVSRRRVGVDQRSPAPAPGGLARSIGWPRSPTGSTSACISVRSAATAVISPSSVVSARRSVRTSPSRLPPRPVGRCVRCQGRPVRQGVLRRSDRAAVRGP